MASEDFTCIVVDSITVNKKAMTGMKQFLFTLFVVNSTHQASKHKTQMLAPKAWC